MELQDGYYQSPRWSWEILDCAMPMTFDTYSNCAHQCLYCFSFFQRAVNHGKDEYLHHRVRSVNVDRVKRMFTDPDKYAGQFAWYIKNRFVLQWGGLSDGFDWYERKFRKSLELLQFFRQIDYPISISTKGVWFLDDPEYVEAFTDARNVQMKYSIITTDEKAAAKIEAGVPAPAERFRALRQLKDMGVGITTVRFRPYVLGLSDLCVEEIFEESERAGVDSLTTEFLCLESRSSNTAAERYRLIGELTGFGEGLFEFYKRNSSASAGLLRLNYELKRRHFDRMEELAAKHNISFYVSDAHHKERSAGAGCCGLPNDGGPLSNINRGQYAEAIQIAKREGKVYWSDIAERAAVLKNIMYESATGFNIATTRARANRRYMTMFDYMQEIWNTPKDVNSPARYFGGALVPGGVDDNGDIIYLYNEPFTQKGVRVNSVAELVNYHAGVRKDQEDGGRFGHVAYPVYVLVDQLEPFRCAAIRELEAARLPYLAFVHPLNMVAFQSAYPNADVISLPADGGKPEQRQVMMEYARAEQVAAVWIIDAYARRFKFGDNVGIRAALSGVEALQSQYADVALAGVGTGGKSSSAFEVDVAVMGAFLARTDTGIDFDPRADGRQDTDFTIAHLDAGWNSLLVRDANMITDARRIAEGVDPYLHDKWDLYTTYAPDRGLIVHWNVFNNPLRPLALEKVLGAAAQEAHENGD